VTHRRGGARGVAPHDVRMKIPAARQPAVSTGVLFAVATPRPQQSHRYSASCSSCSRCDCSCCTSGRCGPAWPAGWCAAVRTAAPSQRGASVRGLYGRGRTVIRHCHALLYRDSPYKRYSEKENDRSPSSKPALRLRHRRLERRRRRGRVAARGQHPALRVGLGRTVVSYIEPPILSVATARRLCGRGKATTPLT
jgi:hypothetical protein